MPRNNEMKIGRWPEWFSSKSQSHILNFTLRQIFEKSWKHAKNVFTCFVDLEKTYNLIPLDKLWQVLQEYGIDGHLLTAVKSLCCQPEVCVCISGKQSKSFHIGVGLQKRCVLPLLNFIIYIN